MKSSLRLFYLGGLTSYRALFSWLTPWILIPSFVVAPIVQAALFSYVGRAAGVGSDSFFLIGNAVQYASVPCLFAMGTDRQQDAIEPAGRVLSRTNPLAHGMAEGCL